mgnify:FL=1|tara:strand:+ start:121 stop:426 length:306 start_codon:yes stop_codon:yes gene_type:complete
MTKDCISMCDVYLIEFKNGKVSKEYKIEDVALVGNMKNKIWEYPLYRNRILRSMPDVSTDKKLKAAQKKAEEGKIVLKNIDFKRLLGFSNVDRGLTDPSKL